MLTLQEIQKELNRRARLFSGLSPAEKRITVARDVLKHIKSGKLQGQRFSFHNLGLLCERPRYSRAAVAIDRAQRIPALRCCAVGAREFFSGHLLGEIPDIWHGHCVGMMSVNDRPSYNPGWDGYSDTDRLRLIFENVIANEGTFRSRRPPVNGKTPGFKG